VLAQRPWVRLEVGAVGVVGTVGVGLTVVVSEPPPPQALRVRVRLAAKAASKALRVNKVLAWMVRCAYGCVMDGFLCAGSEPEVVHGEHFGLVFGDGLGH
jgi:hypothetical protein